MPSNLLGEKMSHFTIYTTDLKNITPQILEAAIKALASQIGADIVTKIEDYYGNVHDVTIGLKTQIMVRGIGFSVENTNLKIHGDNYGQVTEWDRVQTLAKNMIKAYQVAQKAQSLYPGSTMQTHIRNDKSVVMKIRMPVCG